MTHMSLRMRVQGLPLECIGAHGYTKRLLVWTVGPLVLVLVIVCAVVVDLSVRHDRQLTSKDILRRVMPVFLRLAFLVYPIVTNVAFEAFSCYQFEDERG